MKDVQDPPGRTAVAVTDANINVLLINPQTGQLLATTTDPVLPGGKLRVDGKTTLHLSMG